MDKKILIKLQWIQIYYINWLVDYTQSTNSIRHISMKNTFYIQFINLPYKNT